MKPLSRRQMLAALAATGLCAVASRKALASTSSPSEPVLSASGRQQAADKLLAYFTAAAPQLLRPAKGFLSHPNISPSLPGKQYSTTLWDWDTYWTVRGLFHVARLTKDTALRDRIAFHAQGSLKIFLEQQSPEGRIPMLITVSQQDLLGALTPSPNGPNSRNQAKPVFLRKFSRSSAA